MKNIIGVDGVEYQIGNTETDLMSIDIKKIRDEIESKMSALDDMYVYGTHPSSEFQTRLNSLNNVAWIRRFE